MWKNEKRINLRSISKKKKYIKNKNEQDNTRTKRGSSSFDVTQVYEFLIVIIT